MAYHGLSGVRMSARLEWDLEYVEGNDVRIPKLLQAWTAPCTGVLGVSYCA